MMMKKIKMMESIFIEKDLILLNNDIKAILEYYYYNELIIEQFISTKYKGKNKKNKRYSYFRIADYALRIQFNVISLIQEATKLINNIISEINDSYLEEKYIEDLSDETYMDRLDKALGTKKIPHFLLREGFRLRRKLRENKDFFIKILYNEKNILNNKIDDKSSDFSEIDNDNLSDNENENISIKNIIIEIEKNIKTPFSRYMNEVYIILFFMFIKEINNKEIYDEIKNNINKFIDYFKIETYKEFEQFKQKYIDINPKKVENNLISNELSEINKSSYSSKCILASYKVLIDKIFKDPNYIYI